VASSLASSFHTVNASTPATDELQVASVTIYAPGKR